MQLKLSVKLNKTTMKKTFEITILFIVLLAVFVSVAMVFLKPNTDQVACTMEAKICPDGSAVGRSGPKCEFAECPVAVSEKSFILEAKIGEMKSGLDVSVTPISVVEDSRCPSDVTCIQAGTVRVKIKILSGLGESEMIATLNGTPITTEVEQIELVEVTPYPNSKTKINVSDYVFKFKISKRNDSALLNDKIFVSQPLKNTVVKSPLVVKGEARGNWYFEASFPVVLIDANGKELALSPAQAKTDWMTTEFVPFEVTLTFSTPLTKTGTLILKKDNPSGLPENDASISIPVRFEI